MVTGMSAVRQWVTISILTGMVLVHLYFHATADPLRSWPGTVAGCMILAAGLAVISRSMKRGFPMEHSRDDPTGPRGWLIVLVIAGFCLRLYAVSKVPGGLWLDEAHHGLDAMMRDSRGAALPVFYPANTGREPLFLWMVDACRHIWGNTIFALRLPAVISGTLAIPLTYWLARNFMNANGALTAAFLLCVSRWSLTFSRISFRTILVPVFALLAVGLVLRYISNRPLRGALFAGLVTGAGLYTAIPFRIFPFLIPVMILLYASRLGARKTVEAIGIFIAGLVVAASPLILFFMRNPEWLTARMQTTSVVTGLNFESLTAVGANLFRILGMMNIQGDLILRHNMPGYPLFDGITGVFFLIGMAVTDWRQRRFRVMAVWLAGAVIPAAMAVSTTGPHALRTLGVLPAAVIIAAIGFQRTWQVITHRFGRRILAGLAAGIVAWNLVVYFHFYGRLIEEIVPRADAVWGFNVRETQLIQSLNQHGTQQSVIYVSPQLYLHPTIQFLRDDSITLKMIRSPGHLRDLGLTGESFQCILDPVNRNMFWLRNSSLKRFFDFWTETQHISNDEIQDAIHACYIARTGLNNTSDVLLRLELERFQRARIAMVHGFERWIVPGGTGTGETGEMMMDP